MLEERFWEDTDLPGNKSCFSLLSKSTKWGRGLGKARREHGGGGEVLLKKCKFSRNVRAATDQSFK